MAGLVAVVGPPEERWEIGMAKGRISTLTLESVPFPVTAYHEGLPYDPTGASIQFAFLNGPRLKPAPGDWKAGTWDVTITGSYVGLCLIGAGGAVQLSKGVWYAWVKITDAALGETPARMVGRLIVE